MENFNHKEHEDKVRGFAAGRSLSEIAKAESEKQDAAITEAVGNILHKQSLIDGSSANTPVCEKHNFRGIFCPMCEIDGTIPKEKIEKLIADLKRTKEYSRKRINQLIIQRNTTDAMQHLGRENAFEIVIEKLTELLK